MPEAVDVLIARIASRQQGNITRQQLFALGLGDDAIAYRLRRGRLYRVHRGVYSVGKPATTPLERAAAAVLACGPTAVLSHCSALALWGFVKAWPERPEVTATVGRRPAGIVPHRSRTQTRRDIRWHFGIRVTSPARAVLDSAPMLTPKALTRAVNDALHTPFLRRAQLADVRDRYPSHPGAQLLRPFIDTDDGPTRSPWEDDFPAFCAHFGLPCPRINTRVCGFEVDAHFPDERLIVELDGWRSHKGRDRFESDRDRDADTLAGGQATVRITRERIKRAPVREAERLARILAQRRTAETGREQTAGGEQA